MRAIYIDPHARTVTEVDVAANAEGDADYEAMRAALWPDEDKGLLQICPVGAGHVIVIDEEGLLMDWDHQAFFKLTGSAGSQTFAGRALILAETDHGSLAACRLPLALVQATVGWLTPQEVSVPAPTFTPINEDGTLGPPEPLDGRTTRWDYQHQP